MYYNTIISIMFGAVMVVGAIFFICQLYNIVAIDAKARGLKHPKFWGLFAVSGNNSSGLLMYLIGRRRFAIQNMNERDKLEIKRRKKACSVGLVFLAIGAIGLILSIYA